MSSETVKTMGGEDWELWINALDEAGVNIEYLYSFASETGSAHIGFKTDDVDAALAVLDKLGVKVL